MTKKKKAIEKLLEESIFPEEDQPYEVPGNWVWAKIEDVLEPMETRDPKKLNGEVFHYIDVDAIDNETQTVRQVKETEIALAPSRAKRKVSKNDVLISLVRPYLKNIAHVNEQDEKMVASTAFYVCTPKGLLCSKYLYNYLCSNYATQYLIDYTRGDNSPSVRSKDFESMLLPIPPLYEQKRIAEKVDCLLSKIDEAKQLIEEAKETFELRRAAILEKAFTGELTATWRGTMEDNNENYLDHIVNKKLLLYEKLLKKAQQDGVKKPSKPKFYDEPDKIDSLAVIPDSWSYTCLGNVIYDFKYGTSEKSSYGNDGHPVIRIPNIGEEYIDLEDMKYLAVDGKQVEEKVELGDLLIIRSNGSRDLVGKCAIVDEKANGYAYASYLIRMRAIGVYPKFIYWLMKSDIAKRQLFSNSKSSAGINNINTQELASIVIPIPSKKEQMEIVNVVESLINKEIEIYDTLSLALKLDSLKQSILFKAFKGELGTNDPKEEPVIELLKEVQEEKSS